MAVYHKKYRNTGLNAFGKEYTIGDDGLLSPEPSPEAAARFRLFPNYRVVETPPPAEAPVEEPKKPATRRKRTRRKPAAKAAE